MAGKDAVVELARFPRGLTSDRVDLTLDIRVTSGDPRFTYMGYSDPGFDILHHLENAYNWTKRNKPHAFNGLKIGLERFSILEDQEGSRVSIKGFLTDYFTIEGLRKVASPLHDQALHALANNNGTRTPIGITTHFMLLTHEDRLVMTIRGLKGANKGKLSITGEEQMEFSDGHLHKTAQGGFRDEVGIKVSLENIRLLGFAAETDYAYASWASVGRARMTEGMIAKAWKTAKDRSESEALLIAPLTVVEQLRGPQTAEFLTEFVRGGSLGNDKVISLHPTLPWRLGLLKDHLATTGN